MSDLLINRFSFDAELRRLNRQQGVRCIESKVTEVSLGNGAPHRVTVQRADGRGESLTTCTAPGGAIPPRAGS